MIVDSRQSSQWGGTSVTHRDPVLDSDGEAPRPALDRRLGVTDAVDDGRAAARLVDKDVGDEAEEGRRDGRAEHLIERERASVSIRGVAWLD